MMSLAFRLLTGVVVARTMQPSSQAVYGDANKDVILPQPLGS
jgi:hypothetical protein